MPVLRPVSTDSLTEISQYDKIGETEDRTPDLPHAKRTLYH